MLTVSCFYERIFAELVLDEGVGTGSAVY